MPKRQQCFLDITIGGSSAGRIIVEVYDDVVPKTAENFRLLCEQQRYEDVAFHRVIRSFMLQGGDFTRGDGRGGESAWGGKFADENFRLQHTKAGILSMANAGRNTNGSQFFITLAPMPHLDGKHVVFGEVVGGMEVVRKMEAVETDDKDRPITLEKVVIASCGVLAAEEPAPGAAETGDTSAAEMEAQMDEADEAEGALQQHGPAQAGGEDDEDAMDGDDTPAGGDNTTAAPATAPKYKIINGIRVRGRGTHLFRPRPITGRDQFRGEGDQDDYGDGDASGRKRNRGEDSWDHGGEDRNRRRRRDARD